MSTRHDDVLVAARQRRVALDLVPENAPPSHDRPRVGHHVVRWASTIATLALLAGVVMFGVVYAGRLDDPFQQQQVAEAELPEADLAAYRSWADGAGATAYAPIVLTYHDIQAQPGSSPYVVSSDQFARQMRMLHEAGYTTLTAAQFTAYLQGSFRPSGRTVLLTFDDGTAGLWRYADPVLARYGFHAVSFLITGRVGTSAPYYLTWDLVRQMHDDGRWDFGSHTDALHVRVTTGPDGAQGGALSHRAWVNGRLETQDAFAARVRVDLEQSIAAITAQGLPRPSLFAYPFSDVVARGVEAEQAKMPRSLVSSLFSAAFVDVDPGALPVSRREALRDIVERAELFARDTERTLFTRLQEMSTLPVAALDPLTVDQHWLEYAGYPAPVEVHGTSLVADARTETYVFGNWAPQRTSDWVDYTVSATVDGLIPDGVTAGLRVRVGGTGELVVRVSDRAVSLLDAQGRLVGGPLRIPSATRHALAVTVLDGRTVIRVDDRVVAERAVVTGPRAHGGFGGVWARDDAAQTFPALTDLRVVPAGT